MKQWSWELWFSAAVQRDFKVGKASLLHSGWIKWIRNGICVLGEERGAGV